MFDIIAIVSDFESPLFQVLIYLRLLTHLFLKTQKKYLIRRLLIRLKENIEFIRKIHCLLLRRHI